MAKVSGRSSKARFAGYVEKLIEVIGHADRAGRFGTSARAW